MLLFYMLHDRPINWRQNIEARNTTSFRKPADIEDGRLVSPKSHLLGVWMPASFIEQRGRGGEEIKKKGHLSCKIGGKMLISSFL